MTTWFSAIDAAGNSLAQSAIGNRYGFTGREFDVETGLYHYRARAYSPELGRFLQTDPLQIDDENAYAYVTNSPTNYIDPQGLEGMFLLLQQQQVISDVINRNIPIPIPIPKPGTNAPGVDSTTAPVNANAPTANAKNDNKPAQKETPKKNGDDGVYDISA